MAMYRCEARIIGREGRGHSVVAASAYRAGVKLKDEVNGKTHDYSQRYKGVVASEVICPDGAAEWTHDRNRLWNEVERGEKRKDAQLAREFLLAVPPELSKEDQFKLARDWVHKDLVGAGMIAEVSLHHKKNEKNPHVHVLCTMRRIEGDHFSAKKAREWNDVKWLVERRESWCKSVNEALERAGRPERVDHRSLKDQGIDRIPQPKIGAKAMALKRKGLVEDPERFALVRRVKFLNEIRPMINDIRRFGEVQFRVGNMGNSWWEKSIVFMNQAKEKATEATRSIWRRLVGPPRTHDHRPRNEPEMDR